HKLDKSEATLDFSHAAIELERQVRAFDPWPVAEGAIAGEMLRIHAAHAIVRDHHAEPGQVLAAGREGNEPAASRSVPPTISTHGPSCASHDEDRHPRAGRQRTGRHRLARRLAARGDGALRAKAGRSA